MTMPQLRKILASATLCLSGFPLLPAAEWVNHYPGEGAVIQGCSLQTTTDLEESDGLYTYFAPDNKIVYIEESLATCSMAVCVRYLFDESGDFVAASCRISSLDISSEEWTHNQHILIPGQLLKVDRCGINETVDARAKRIKQHCLSDLQNQSKEIKNDHAPLT